MNFPSMGQTYHNNSHQPVNKNRCVNMNKIYLALCLLFYGSIFYFRIHHIDSITKIIIPLFVSIIFLFVTLVNRMTNGKNRILVLVFFFIFIGDCIINLTKSLQYSIVFFSLSHVSLGIYYFLDIPFRKKDLVYLLPLYLFSTLLFCRVYRDIQHMSLVYVVVLYLNILNFMLWRALCYLRKDQMDYRTILIIAGSLLFYLTDISVGLYVIYSLEIFITVIWILYPPALISLSLMNSQLFKNKYVHKRQVI